MSVKFELNSLRTCFPCFEMVLIVCVYNIEWKEQIKTFSGECEEKEEETKNVQHSRRDAIMYIIYH